MRISHIPCKSMSHIKNLSYHPASLIWRSSLLFQPHHHIGNRCSSHTVSFHTRLILERQYGRPFNHHRKGNDCARNGGRASVYVASPRSTRVAPINGCSAGASSPYSMNRSTDLAPCRAVTTARQSCVKNGYNRFSPSLVEG